MAYRKLDMSLVRTRVSNRTRPAFVPIPGSYQYATVLHNTHTILSYPPPPPPPPPHHHHHQPPSATWESVFRSSYSIGRRSSVSCACLCHLHRTIDRLPSLLPYNGV